MRPLPFSLGRAAQRRATRAGKTGAVATAFTVLDRALKLYDRSPIKPGRSTGVQARDASGCSQRQEADGGWGGIQPPWVYSILALHLTGCPLDDPALVAAIKGLDGFLIREETDRRRRPPARGLPVAGVGHLPRPHRAARCRRCPPTIPPCGRRSTGCSAKRSRVKGDWAVRRPDLAAAGWAFEFANDAYPDIDDTAEVVLALRRIGLESRPDVAAAVERGIEWAVGMQSRDGGWGAFDADNTRRLVEKLPFCDFGAVIDPPSADVTAHVVEMLAHSGMAQTEACRRGVRWLLDAQEADGSWFGRWGANYVYGTGAVVPALVAAGVATDSIPVRRAVRWLEKHQNPDGGWGEDLRSYVDDEWRGRGESTPSQTAWALLGAACRRSRH